MRVPHEYRLAWGIGARAITLHCSMPVGGMTSRRTTYREATSRKLSRGAGTYSDA